MPKFCWHIKQLLVLRADPGILNNKKSSDQESRKLVLALT